MHVALHTDATPGFAQRVWILLGTRLTNPQFFKLLPYWNLPIASVLQNSSDEQVIGHNDFTFRFLQRAVGLLATQVQDLIPFFLVNSHSRGASIQSGSSKRTEGVCTGFDVGMVGVATGGTKTGLETGEVDGVATGGTKTGLDTGEVDGVATGGTETGLDTGDVNGAEVMGSDTGLVGTTTGATDGQREGTGKDVVGALTGLPCGKDVVGVLTGLP